MYTFYHDLHAKNLKFKVGDEVLLMRSQRPKPGRSEKFEPNYQPEWSIIDLSKQYAIIKDKSGRTETVTLRRFQKNLTLSTSNDLLDESDDEIDDTGEPPVQDNQTNQSIQLTTPE